jgi:hypothetical protein
MNLVLKQVEKETETEIETETDRDEAVEKENPCCHQMETCSL